LVTPALPRSSQISVSIEPIPFPNLESLLPRKLNFTIPGAAADSAGSSLSPLPFKSRKYGSETLLASETELKTGIISGARVGKQPDPTTHNNTADNVIRNINNPFLYEKQHLYRKHEAE
jgi:hypothetical protein